MFSLRMKLMPSDAVPSLTTLSLPLVKDNCVANLPTAAFDASSSPAPQWIAEPAALKEPLFIVISFGQGTTSIVLTCSDEQATAAARTANDNMIFFICAKVFVLSLAQIYQLKSSFASVRNHYPSASIMICTVITLRKMDSG